MNAAGLIFDDSPHYIDHLGPFCALMKWPLFVCEPSIADQCRAYYPDLEVVEKDLFSLELPNPVLSCDTRALLQAAFPLQPIRSLWLPHGNSDKGWKSPFFEALTPNEPALVYGQKMLDFLQAKQVQARTFPIGNFRRAYWQKHRPFYDSLIHEKISQSRPLFLYAPTWTDNEDNGSFWKAFPALVKTLPDAYTLLVKPHPNIRRQDELRLERLIGQTQRHNIQFLEDFPPIYPLLNVCDAYIGDMSSIGYDFLHFNKPMFFLNPNQRKPSDPGLYLFRCGIEADSSQIFSLYQNRDCLSAIRKQIYDYTFAPSPDWDQLRNHLS